MSSATFAPREVEDFADVDADSPLDERPIIDHRRRPTQLECARPTINLLHPFVRSSTPVYLLTDAWFTLDTHESLTIQSRSSTAKQSEDNVVDLLQREIEQEI